jgi:hypothetical protein
LPGNKAPVATATGKPVAPAAIYWGTKHKVAPPVMGKLYRDQMRQLGGNVQRVQLPGEQTHFSTPWPAAKGCPAQ